MDSTTIRTLQEIGTDLIHSFTAILFETFLLAIYTVLVIKTCCMLGRKASQSRVSFVTLIVILLMYSMALTMWSFDVTNFIHQVQIPLLRNPDAPLADKYAESQQSLFHLLAPLDLLYAYEAILGDGIVVWRVYVLWGNTKLAAALLTFCVARLGTKIIDGSFQSPAFCKNVQTVSYSTPTATTAVATILIGWKTWEYRKSTKVLSNAATSSSGGSRTHMVERVLMVLVESGFIYFIFFLIIAIFNTPGIESNAGLSFAFFVYSYCTSVVVGLYPTIVILLTTSDKSSELGSTISNSIQLSNRSGPSTIKVSVNSVKHKGDGGIGSSEFELSQFKLATSSDGISAEEV
ncbi:hypothetical protein H0H92_005235 [Tricholoma furcatifolium]|nr:hypothetical protein H0H92_005235 [Tricholoma furcatifolium]